MQLPFESHIENLIESGFQVLQIATAERDRCEKALQAVAKKIDMEVVTWDSISGLSTDKTVVDPIDALTLMDDKNDKYQWRKKAILFIFRNLHTYLEDSNVRQALQNLYYDKKLSNANTKHPLVILSNAAVINAEIAPCITVVEFSLPDESQLETVFNDLRECIAVNDENKANTDAPVVTCDDELKGRVIQAMRGLSKIEAEDILAFGLRTNRGFGQGLVDTIEDQKASTLEKSEVLTYVPKDRIATMDEIGGYENLKEFIETRKVAYTKKAREVGIDLPKGIELLGIPGSGKSVCGKVLARAMGLPLVVMNFSAVFGSLVGESERRVRTALNTVDALDGAVMLVDEAEKGLSGASDGVGDSGVTRRVFGVLLTWLTEKRSRTFVVMTMNRTRGIPPEFLRAGRFDKIFYTDLPDNEERDQILKIHCRKRKIDPLQYEYAGWTKLIQKTDRFVGSELEQIIADARFLSFARRQDGTPSIEEFLLAAEGILPIADSEKENIEEIRRMCEGRACPVSKRYVEKRDKTRRSVTVNN